MPEKGLSSAPSSTYWTFFRSNYLHRWRFGVLTALVFVSMMVVWSIDGCTIKSLLEAWRFRHGFTSMQVNISSDISETHYQSFAAKTSNLPAFAANTSNLPAFAANTSNLPAFAPNETEIPVAEPTQNQTNWTRLPSEANSTYVGSPSEKNGGKPKLSTDLKWVLAELEPKFTEKLLARWLEPGGEPCRESKAVQISIPGLDGRNLVELSAGEIHEFVFQALNESGNPVCLGGDYFETDLSGEKWKSRPPVKDFGNGSYSVLLQVHPDFAGDFNLTVSLLFRHFQGLKFSPQRFSFDKELRRIRIKFYKTEARLPEIQGCKQSDFTRDIWSGRWTRHGKNDNCHISDDGRYRCLPADFPCQSPWCNGSLGLLESNGWVYSTHCSFRMFSTDSAWDCLKNRWIFFWGDSNHVDTIRNMLNFVLDLPEIPSVPRRFDMNFSNHRDPSQSVRITSIFNGHWNETQNYLGLDSLRHEGFRNLLKKYFSEATVPDTVIINSGLHDGVHWPNIRAFSKGADYTTLFWKDVMDSIRQRGLRVPKIIYRHTIATGGYARALAFNPNKMEAFNGVFLEKMKTAGLVSGVIDNFDMTYPWHYDNRCNDGVHYGRAPAKMKWRDGEIGHYYFVDLMLAHILFNVLCTR